MLDGSRGLTYEGAGVDIRAGDSLISKISPCAEATHRPGTMAGIGGFAALFDPKGANFIDPILVSGADGVGTKLKLAIETKIHNTVGIDLVAMCANDVLVQGAKPLFFLDYFASSNLDNDDCAETVIKGVAEGCRQARCALIGGETAQMPGFYKTNDYDLAGFCVGAVEREELIDGSRVEPGDIIIGLASSGVHSNGFSLIRHLAELEKLNWKMPAPFQKNTSLGEALLTPTRIYAQSILAVLESNHVNGLAHVTGGGLTENLPRILPEGLRAVVDVSAWTPPSVFQWIAETGNVALKEMLRTFNCGIGFCVVAAEENIDNLTRRLIENGEDPKIIGRIESHEDSKTCYESLEHLWS